MYKRLLVVSDTALYKNTDGVFGFAAVVKELELIQHDFKEIVWIGAKRPDRMESGALVKIKAKNIKTILIPQMGGKSVKEVGKIFLLYPYLFFFLLYQISKANVIHTRLPSHPGFIALIVSFLFYKKIWWNKFAGSWESSTLPFFYKFQRSILLKAKHTKVTINGLWKNQPTHCISFENPCLYESDLKTGKSFCDNKTFTSPFTFVFIGRLDNAKGMDKIVEALKNTTIEDIHQVHFIGDSPEKESYESDCAFLGSKVLFHGFLASDKVHHVLEQADFLLLPSKSEGFPKVIAEAACYGVIPIVSDVGSIPQYINSNNGFLWKREGTVLFGEVLKNALQTPVDQLKNKSKNIHVLAKMFTFEIYKSKLQKLLLSNSK